MNTFQKAFGTKWYITLGVLIGQVGAYIRIWHLWAIGGVVVGAVLAWAQKPLWYSFLIAVIVAFSLKALGFVLRVIGGLAMRHMMLDAMTMAEKEGLRPWDEIKKEIR